MADKDPLPAPAQIDIRRELAALKAVQAPLIFFDIASTYGAHNGVVNMTLETGLHTLFDGQAVAESRVVGHLRFPVTAIPHLRDTLDRIELLLQPPASDEKN